MKGLGLAYDRRSQVKDAKPASSEAFWTRCPLTIPSECMSWSTRFSKPILRSRPSSGSRKFGDHLKEAAPAALEVLKDGLFDATVVLTLSEKYRRRFRAPNMLKRLVQEAHCREKGVRIFLNMSSDERLVGALCAETYEEQRRMERGQRVGGT
jgi:hypothetical protein